MRKFRADADERFRTLQRNRVYQKRLDTRTAMATEEQNMRNYTAALARRQLREEERIARRQQRELERVRREQEVAQARRQRQLQLQALTESKASLRAGTGGPGMVAVGAVLVSERSSYRSNSTTHSVRSYNSSDDALSSVSAPVAAAVRPSSPDRAEFSSSLLPSLVDDGRDMGVAHAEAMRAAAGSRAGTPSSVPRLRLSFIERRREKVHFPAPATDRTDYSTHRSTETSRSKGSTRRARPQSARSSRSSRSSGSNPIHGGGSSPHSQGSQHSATSHGSALVGGSSATSPRRQGKAARRPQSAPRRRTRKPSAQQLPSIPQADVFADPTVPTAGHPVAAGVLSRSGSAGMEGGSVTSGDSARSSNSAGSNPSGPAAGTGAAAADSEASGGTAQDSHRNPLSARDGARSVSDGSARTGAGVGVGVTGDAGSSQGSDTRRSSLRSASAHGRQRPSSAGSVRFADQVEAASVVSDQFVVQVEPASARVGDSEDEGNPMAS